LLKVFFEVGYCNFALGAIHKGRPQSGGCPVRNFADKGRGGSSNADVRTFGAKTPEFPEFMVCPHGQGGVQPVRTRGEGVNFSRFCANVLYGWPLRERSS